MRKDLIEAYLGYYEDELSHVADKERAATVLINQASPKARLAVYLTWNGIIGYTESIYAIATGDI